MKTQFVILIVAVVLLQLIANSEAFLSTLWNAAKSIFGKRGLRNLDNLDDDIFEPEMSEADLRYLQDLLR
uniref:Amphipathic peptide CT2 n=1 Tax=Vaejovis mexicanus smithi TaxID=1562928 RepID=NDB4E_VAEMS|nr:RecName: Full=Amphipathic peptide CT2; Short=VmCT2; AltName: Full=Non-disulfide-bridged peptide 4.14; Short=NDBP-4.14; AltName: Full=Non-disulfide-bridged peptide 5.14; Short=NDBP-5.14; Flags: Precursor [Vaejovis smithi]AFH87945.1 CT2 precursor [Vaejovis mexicanus]